MGRTAATQASSEDEPLTAGSALAASFAALIDSHRGIVFKVAHTYCWLAADRDDLVQDILTQAWRAFPSYDHARPFSPWLYRVALNVAISWVRGPGRRRQMTEPFDPDRHDSPAPRPGDEEENLRALHRVIHTFEPLNRALLLLYLDDHSYREIATVLGLTETNVATKIGRLKKHLKQALGQRS